MKKRLISGLVAMSTLVAGCGSNGLSVRERPGQDYALYMNSMYAIPAADEQREPAQVRFPVRLGVAQIGEVAPPASMVAALRTESKLFAAVEGMPGVTPAMQQQQVHYNRQWRAYQGVSTPVDAGTGAREHLRSMCRMARDMGMTHLLIFGGTIDHDTNSTGLAALDLTIIGAFVVPSREIRATARASGAMIDVASESVVLIASADSDRTKWTPAAGRERDELKLMHQMRDDLVEKMTKNLIDKCHDRAGGTAVARGDPSGK